MTTMTMTTKKTTTTTSARSVKVRKLAKKAGFVIWEECSWAGDRVGKIDWACEYDEELEKFYDLVVKETLKNVKNKKIEL